MKVVVADVDAQALAALDFDLCARCDATDPAQVNALADQVYERFGDVGVLFSNTGIMAGDASFDTPLAVWNKVMSVTFTANVVCCNAFVPRMQRQARKRAAVVLTSSLSGLLNTCAQTGAAYTVAKNATRVYAESLAVDLLRSSPSISVHCLCPGPVNTPLLRNSRLETGKQSFAFEKDGINDEVLQNGLQPSAVAEALFKGVADGRFYVVVVDPKTSNASLIAEAMRMQVDVVENGGATPFGFGAGASDDAAAAATRTRLFEAFKRGLPKRKPKL